MDTYTLKLISGNNYNLYLGTTLVSDSDLATLFGTAGSAYFVFDFNSGTPSSLTAVSIINSSDTEVMGITGLAAGTVKEDYNFKGEWDGVSTTFTSFAQLSGQALDEAELSFLMGKIKSAGPGKAKELTAADYNYHDSGSVDDGVALWKLSSGVYDGNRTKVYFATSFSLNTCSDLILVGKRENSIATIVRFDRGTVQAYIFRVTDSGVISAQTEITSSYYIQDNLTSSATNYPLSANQGRVLKGLIDAIVVPTKTSDLTNDGSDGTSTYVEADDLATVATSGSYNDLSNTPTIPTVNDSTITLTNNGTTVDSFTTNASSAKTIALSAPEITMTSTDPGEGSALAANNFVAVYGSSTQVQTADIANGAVTSDKIDYSTIPQMVTVGFGSGQNGATSRVVLAQESVSGLNTSWQYMCVVSIGTLFALGSTSAIALADFTISSPATDITTPGRIRAGSNQTTTTYCVPFTPPAASFTMNFNGYGDVGGLYWEDATVYFIPIRPASA